eukprot:507283_1
MTSALQSNTWFTFSSCPDEVEDYYHLKAPNSGQVNGTIDLLLNWGPIWFLIAAPFCAYILSYPIIGLKLNTKIAVILLFSGNVLRCIPSILEACSFINYSISNKFWHTLIFLHIGQILNAIAGPFVMGPPSKLSVIWFPQRQRNTATAIAAVSNTFGNCFGFLLGPLIVKTGNDIPLLLYTNLALATIPTIFILFYFPNSPSKLPTIAARSAFLSVSIREIKSKQQIIESNINEQALINDKYLNNEINRNKFTLKQHLKNFGSEIIECILNYSTVVTVIVGGMEGGMFAAWAGVLQDMLSPLGLNDTDIGLMGFNISLFSMIGGLITGPVADKYFEKKLRKFIYILFVLTLIVLLILLFIIPSPFSNDSLIILSNNTCQLTKNIVLNVFIALLGICEGGLVPLFYELSVEVSYPVSEGSSAMLLVYVLNITCLVFVGIGNWLNTKWETLFAILICGLCLLFISTIKEQYKRK